MKLVYRSSCSIKLYDDFPTIESYKMQCGDNKDVLEEFITRVEKNSSEDSARDKLSKFQKVQIIFNQRGKDF